jgi:hypothetical protein
MRVIWFERSAVRDSGPDEWLESNARSAPLPPGSKYPEKRYWEISTLAEAYVGLEEDR